MKKVDFFIIGAPKSGTTSLYEYLKTHPHICFSDSKEPHYFSFDFPGYCTTKTLDEYHQKEFNQCPREKVLWGEASVWYLYSRVAVEEIKRYNPDAKILIMLRNPVEMLYSHHSQMLYNLDEDVEDFEQAWQLQSARASGRKLPARCRVAEFLLYKRVGSFGEQVERVLKFFPDHQVKVIFFEDLTGTPQKVYLDVLSFLGLDDDGRREFHVANPGKTIKFKPLTIFIERPPALLVAITTALKKVTGVHRFGVYRLMHQINDRFNAKRQSRKALCPEFKRTILEELNSDILKLERLLQVDLSSWKEN